MNEAGKVDALTHSRDFGQEHAQVLILWGQSTHIRLIDIYIYIYDIYIYTYVYIIYIYHIYIYHIYIYHIYIYHIYIYISYIYIYHIYIYIIYTYHIYIYIYGSHWWSLSLSLVCPCFIFVPKCHKSVPKRPSSLPGSSSNSWPRHSKNILPGSSKVSGLELTGWKKEERCNIWFVMICYVYNIFIYPYNGLQWWI